MSAFLPEPDSVGVALRAYFGARKQTSGKLLRPAPVLVSAREFLLFPGPTQQPFPLADLVRYRSRAFVAENAQRS